jgi:large subunit ribosomal protein L14e
MILTPYTLPALPRAAGTGAVKKALEKANVAEKWASSSWAKKLAVREQRKKQNDFERFEIGLLKRQKRDLVRRRRAEGGKNGMIDARFVLQVRKAHAKEKKSATA